MVTEDGYSNAVVLGKHGCGCGGGLVRCRFLREQEARGENKQENDKSLERHARWKGI